MARRVLGLALVAIGAWLLREALYAVVLSVERGSPLEEALIGRQPTSLFRIISTGLILLGGILATLNLRFGGVAALIGSLLFGALTFAALQIAQDFNDVILGGAAALLALVILFLKRN
ncbi:MAG: hypothetical protein AAFR74_03255 [Pseudomonadota bacterium]